MRAFLCILVLSGCFLFSGASVHAAFLYFDPPELSVYRGDTVTLRLRIDTDEGECINTVDAIVKYPSSIRAVDVSRGESILSVWVEAPVIDEETKTITFAGGIPGGYCGRVAGDPKLTNVIAEIAFRSPGLSIGATEVDKNPEVTIGEGSQVLLHDGFGTRAPLRTASSRITLLDTPGSAQQDSWTDRVVADDIPPSDFAITLTRDDAAFSGKYFISFNSQDKQSGIDHYEVMEEPFDDFNLFRWGRADAPWVTAESPYVLKDQSLNSTIRVKAIDKAGLEQIAVLVPDVALRSVSLERLIFFTILIVVVVALVIFVGFALYRRKRSLEKQLIQEHDTLE